VHEVGHCEPVGHLPLLVWQHQHQQQQIQQMAPARAENKTWKRVAPKLRAVAALSSSGCSALSAGCGSSDHGEECRTCGHEGAAPVDETPLSTVPAPAPVRGRSTGYAAPFRPAPQLLSRPGSNVGIATVSDVNSGASEGGAAVVVVAGASTSASALSSSTGRGDEEETDAVHASDRRRNQEDDLSASKGPSSGKRRPWRHLRWAAALASLRDRTSKMPEVMDERPLVAAGRTIGGGVRLRPHALPQLDELLSATAAAEMAQAEAATALQAAFRGFAARSSHLHGVASRSVFSGPASTAAHVAIIAKGRLSRQASGVTHAVAAAMEYVQQAATALQAAWRGFSLRQDMSTSPPPPPPPPQPSQPTSLVESIAGVHGSEAARHARAARVRNRLEAQQDGGLRQSAVVGGAARPSRMGGAADSTTSTRQGEKPYGIGKQYLKAPLPECFRRQ